MSQEKPVDTVDPPVEGEVDAEGEDYLHIGNLIEIISEMYGYTVGRVIYRDLNLVRVMPQEVSDRAIDFPMTEDGSTFAPDLGVQSIELRDSHASNYYVDFLGARPGDTLEFFTIDGMNAAPTGTVDEVYKTASKDAIKLTDGRILKFNLIGPTLPIAVIRVGSSVAEEAAVAEQAPVEQENDVPAGVDILALLRSVIPAATMEVVPTAERSYPDSMQREEMFQDLLADVNVKQRTNPRRIRFIEREVDLSVALKNRSLLNDESGRVIGPAPYLLTTIKEAIAASSGALPAAVPIIEAARVLNLDDANPSFSHKKSDVFPRNLATVEEASNDLATRYLDGEEERNFFDYTYDLLSRDQAVLQGNTPTEWREDQDIIRTAGMGTPVEGLSKGLPNKRNKGEDPPPISMAFLVSDITDRTVRVLSPDRQVHQKTGAVHLVAPSDPSTITGYVVLPPKAALALRPPKNNGDLPTALLYSASLESDNLPTIAEALRNLYSAESSPQNAWTLSAEATGEVNVAEWLKAVLQYAVHPVDSQGPRTPRLLGLLDTFGLGVADMSPAVSDVIWNWVAESQTIWQNLLSAKRTEIQTALDNEEARTYQSVTDTQGVAAPLWSALLLAEPLKDLLEDIKRRNPSVANAPTLMTASLLMEAQGDAVPLVWTEIAKLDSRELADIDVASAATSLADSRAYILRRKALIAAPFVAMHAAPEINTCSHVNRLESIRNVEDFLSRSRLLRQFIEEFQGPASESSGNKDWVTCILCKKSCVCHHELVELEALAQPSRMDAIYKQMLIRFGGERYEGKIVCKVCGQALQEIDYDEHVEFDDNGRPIVGASVLTQEQMDDPAETSWTKVLAPPVTFATQSQRDISIILQFILERGGLLASPSVIQQIVRYADLYVNLRAPPRNAYEAQRTKMLTSASTKLKTGSGTGVAAIPPYTTILNQLIVSAVMAMTVISIQSADPPIVVNYPFALCTFSRGGYPFDPASKPEDPGALLYVACVVASIDRNVAPWNSLTWTGLTTLDSRRKKILPVAMSAIQIILGADPKSAPLSFTPEIRQAISKARDDVEGIKLRSLVSRKDRLPPGFRPEPFPPKLNRPSVERDPVRALRDAGVNGAPVASALKQQSIAIVAELHEAASNAVAIMIASGQNPSEDAVCCTVPFSQVAELQGLPENLQLVKAREILRGANPISVNAGTHLWPVYETPVPQPVEQTVGEEVFFKLFLKYCYRGHHVGESHEFSVGNECRQCHLVLGKSPDLIDFGKEGAAILAAQQGDLRIEVTQAAFLALSEAIRRRRVFAAPVSTTRNPWIAGLEDVLAIAKKGSNTEFAVALEESLAQVASVKPGEVLSEMDRATLWIQMATFMDGARSVVEDRIGPLRARGAGRSARADEAMNAMAAFDALTEDPFIEGPRSVQEYWCAKVQAAGAGYGIKVVHGASWTTTLSEKHIDMLNKLMTNNSQWFSGTVKAEVQPVLKSLAMSIGSMLSTWIKKVRPVTGAENIWGVEEAQMVLRSIVLQGWRDALTTTSWMYESIPSGSSRESIASSIADWTRALMLHTKQQFVKYSKDTIKKVLQDRAGLERDTIVEEFESIKDDDQRAAELIKKQFRIGRWAGGANLQKYDPDTFEFENEQRKRMGIMDPIGDLIVPQAVMDAAPEDGYDVAQGAEGDDY